MLISLFISSIDGLVTIYNFVDTIFQNDFLIKFNRGIPEILRINFVSVLNKFMTVKGKEVIRWAIKKSGLLDFINLISGKIYYLFYKMYKTQNS